MTLQRHSNVRVYALPLGVERGLRLDHVGGGVVGVQVGLALPHVVLSCRYEEVVFEIRDVPERSKTN